MTVEAQSPLVWAAIGSNLAGATAPRFFSSPFAGQVLILGVVERASGVGVALAASPRALPAQLAFAQVTQSHGGPTFPVLQAAAVDGGALLLAQLDRASGSGAGLVFLPGPAPARVDWQAVPASPSGPAFPQLFAAAAGGGTLVLAVGNRAPGPGTALTHLAGTIPGSLRLDPVTQDAGGPRFPDAFAGVAGGGALLLFVATTAAGTGEGLAGLPAVPPRLAWKPLAQNLSGPRFPDHFEATVEGGSVVLARLDTAFGIGVDAAFVTS